MKPRHSFSIAAGPGLANAIRRSLLADVASLAPREVTIRRNTSGHTDEFLAHRIGLIPFRRTGEGNELRLQMKRVDAGTQPLCASNLIGPGIEPVHPAIPIVVLGPDQEVDLTVHFDEQTITHTGQHIPLLRIGRLRKSGKVGEVGCQTRSKLKRVYNA